MDVIFGYPLVLLQVGFRVVSVYLEDFEVEDWGFRRDSGLIAITLLPSALACQRLC